MLGDMGFPSRWARPLCQAFVTAHGATWVGRPPRQSTKLALSRQARSITKTCWKLNVMLFFAGRAGGATASISRLLNAVTKRATYDDCNYSRDLRSRKWGSGIKLRGNNLELPMSALGQKRTFECVRAMSALPPKADMFSMIVMSALCHKQTCDIRAMNAIDRLYRQRHAVDVARRRGAVSLMKISLRSMAQ